MFADPPAGASDGFAILGAFVNTFKCDLKIGLGMRGRFCGSMVGRYSSKSILLPLCLIPRFTGSAIRHKLGDVARDGGLPRFKLLEFGGEIDCSAQLKVCF